MYYLFALITATLISLIVVPTMVRIAPKLGMLDYPNSRKVHVNPIPRVGGIGIVAGAISTVIIWAPKSQLVLSYLLGSIVLLAFGIWDDKRDLGARTKFLGQIVAVLAVVVFGGIYIKSFPFLNEPLPMILGSAFTIFAMVGVINAVNTSDGLDGLAGGLSILSFAAILFLAYLVGGKNVALILVVSAIGGTFGFLRYNTYPAIVFMGDGGSQFLGYSLGFLVILLTQKIDPSLSPLVVLLLLGLPVVDMIAVMIRRSRKNLPLFKATNDHLHHRLLRLGFVHKESVVIIYSLQSVFMLSGIYLRYANEWLIATFYTVLIGCIYASVHFAEIRGWQANRYQLLAKLEDRLHIAKPHMFFVIVPRRFLEFIIPIYLVAVSFWVNDVPRDFGVVAGILALVVLFLFFVSKLQDSAIHRILIYITAAFIVYLSFYDRISWAPWVFNLEKIFFGAVTLAIMLAIKFAPGRRKEEFKTTAMDYLIGFIMLIGMILVQTKIVEFSASIIILQLVIILYACEFLFVERRERTNWLGPSLLVTLGVITLRGLDIVHIELRLF